MTFEQIRALFKDYTAVCDDRQRLIYKLVNQTKGINGDMAEVGVYRGGTSVLIANADPSRHLYACDTFTGLPSPTPGVDTHQKGDFKDTSYEGVKKLLRPYPNVRVVRGMFPDERRHSPGYRLNNRYFSFVHLDVDLYESTLACLEFFYTRMPAGAALVVDDYGMPSCPGVKLAVDAFMANKPEKVIDSGFKSCYFIKE